MCEKADAYRWESKDDDEHTMRRSAENIDPWLGYNEMSFKRNRVPGKNVRKLKGNKRRVVELHMMNAMRACNLESRKSNYVRKRIEMIWMIKTWKKAQKTERGGKRSEQTA